MEATGIPTIQASRSGGWVAEALREARVRKRLTQRELATRLRVSQSTISFWERGIETPSVEHIVALATELPEVVEGLPSHERELLRRLVRLERQLFDGRCACPGCSCGSTATNLSLTGQQSERCIST